jgi:hypothetical protein
MLSICKYFFEIIKDILRIDEQKKLILYVPKKGYIYPIIKVNIWDHRSIGPPHKIPIRIKRITTVRDLYEIIDTELAKDNPKKLLYYVKILYDIFINNRNDIPYDSTVNLSKSRIDIRKCKGEDNQYAQQAWFRVTRPGDVVQVPRSSVFWEMN